MSNFISRTVGFVSRAAPRDRKLRQPGILQQRTTIEHLESRTLLSTTVPGGVISTNTMWPASGAPYILSGTVYVRNGATLTIQPGVQVTGGGYLYVSDNGSGGVLNAQGVASGPVVTFSTRVYVETGGDFQLTNDTFNSYAEFDSAFTGSTQFSGNTFPNSNTVGVGATALNIPNLVGSPVANTFTAGTTATVEPNASETLTTSVMWPHISTITQYSLYDPLYVRSHATLTLASGVQLGGSSLQISDDGSGGVLAAPGGVTFSNRVYISSGGDFQLTGDTFNAYAEFDSAFTGSTQFSGNTFPNSNTAGVGATALNIPNLVGSPLANTFTAGTTATVEPNASETLTTSVMWPYISTITQYSLYDPLYVRNHATLTLASGVQLGGSSLQISDDGSGGALNAVGVTFANAVGLLSGSQGTVEYNTFESSALTVDSASAAAVTENSIGAGGVRASGTSSATVNLANNWWGTTNRMTIASLITDHMTNASLPTINFQLPLPTPPVVPPLLVTSPGAQAAIIGQSQLLALGNLFESGATAPFTVSVNWGDGSAVTSFNVTAAGAIPATAPTFAASGGITVSVSVTDSASHTSNTSTFAVNVAALPASITVTPPGGQSATAGQSQAFPLGSFTASNATAPFTVNVNWGDASPAGSFFVTSAGTIPATSHTFASGGNDTVTVSVSDSAGHSSNSAMFAVSVAVPSATITVTPASAQAATAGQSQSFSLGNFSQTNATGPFSISVNWGDGLANDNFSIASAGTIPARFHTFSSSGSKTVTVTITDSGGHTSNSPTFAVNVAAAPTTITVTPLGNQAATPGQSASIALGSFIESNATGPFTVAVAWGDSTNSSFSVTSAGTISATAHTYAASGTKAVGVTVTDSAGHTSNSAMVTVTVAVSTTTIAVTPPAAQAATAGQSQSISLGSFAATNATGPFTVTVNWGDGSPVQTFSQTAAGAISAENHAFIIGGNTSVTLIVNDSAGHVSSSSTF